MLSSNSKNATINETIQGKKCYFYIQYQNFGIIGFKDASFNNLSDGSSNGGYIIYLVNEIGQSSTISWQSKKLQREVEKAVASETLVEVECAKAYYWIARLLKKTLHNNNKKQLLPATECNR